MAPALARFADGGRRPGRLAHQADMRGLGAPQANGQGAVEPAAATEIGLGAAVQVSLSGGWRRADFSEEGVVIEVVPAGSGLRSPRVVCLRPSGSSRSTVIRYVVQCWDCRVLRRMAEMLVVSP